MILKYYLLQLDIEQLLQKLHDDYSFLNLALLLIIS